MSEAHHRRRRRSKPSATSGPGGSFSDVFGGPPRHAAPFAGSAAPSRDEYAEIFGGVDTSCSIPYLDLPPAIDDGGSGWAASGVDYTEVFRGAEFVDFAVPYDEILAANGDRRKLCGSSPDHRQFSQCKMEPTYRSSTYSSKDSGPYLEEDEYSPGSFSSNGPKQFNMSYHKATQVESDNYVGSKTFKFEPPPSYMVDSLHSDQKAVNKESLIPENMNANHDEGGNSYPPSYSNDILSRMESEISEDKKKQSVPTDRVFSNGNVKVDHIDPTEIHSASGKGAFDQDYGFLNVSQINIGAAPVEDSPPPRPPPKLMTKQKKSTVKHDSYATTSLHSPSFGLGVKRDLCQGAVKDESSNFLDGEAGVCSAAAASAAAMKEAMEQAEVRLRAAKELMQKKRESAKFKKQQSHHGAADGLIQSVDKAPEKLEQMKDSSEEWESNLKSTVHSISSQEHRNLVAGLPLPSNAGNGSCSASVDKVCQNREEEISQDISKMRKFENWRSNNDFYELINSGKNLKFRNELRKNTPVETKLPLELDRYKERTYECSQWGSLIQNKGSQETCSSGEIDMEFEDVKEDFVSCDEAEVVTLASVRMGSNVHGGIGTDQKNGIPISGHVQHEVPQSHRQGKLVDLCWNEKINDRAGCSNAMSDSYGDHGSLEVSYSENKNFLQNEETFSTAKPSYICDGIVGFRPFMNQKSAPPHIGILEDANDGQGHKKKETVEWTGQTTESMSTRMSCLQNEDKSTFKEDFEAQSETHGSEDFEAQNETLEHGIQTYDIAFVSESKEARDEGTDNSSNEDNTELAIPKHTEELDAFKAAAKLTESKLTANVSPKLDDVNYAIEKSMLTIQADEPNEVVNTESALECDEPENVMESIDSSEFSRIFEADNTKEVSNENAASQEKEANVDQVQYSDDAERQEDPRDNYCKNQQTEECVMLSSDSVDSSDVLKDGVASLIDGESVTTDADKNAGAVNADDYSAPNNVAFGNSVNSVQSIQNTIIDSSKTSNERLPNRSDSKEAAEKWQSTQVEMESSQQGGKASRREVEEEIPRINMDIREDQEGGKLLKTESEDLPVASSDKNDSISRSFDGPASAYVENHDGKSFGAHRLKETATVRVIEEAKELDKRVLQRLEEEKQKERESELDREVERRRRRIEEDREREREREKDRLAVERATHEAHERAEKLAMERITAARQRAHAEAREREGKVNSEFRDKLLTEKASRDARLRAERAAVERATAEARERAMEKAKAEKEAADAKERLERIKSFNLKPSSEVSQQQDTQLRRAVSDNYIRDLNSRNNKVNEESALRHKARLERHQRTAERAAKALAEKNTRDLLAQREQIERNRLAEFLDPEVKRWSNGKEGNLRALLSTLQYILGSDSGWQPVPLTELITAAAVKKAYRKATLCVHPDKLQQRGATVKQKYICEKVFDLLKEAWNKFNSIAE